MKQIVAVVLVFMLNPTLGLVLSLLVALNTSDDYRSNRGDLLQFILITAMWISLINITKTISGDQGIYTRMFVAVRENGFVNSVFNAWGGTGKEPAFSFIMWCLYWLTGGNVRMYYFLLSMAIYLFHFMATYALFKKMDLPKGVLICGVLLLTFFTQYFVMTLQILRQMLAAGVMIYALVYRVVNGRNNWFLLIAAVLIHTSSAFFAGVSLVPWFYSWMGWKRIAIVLGCFIPIIVFNGAVAGLFGGSTGIDAIDYGLATYGNTGYADAGGLDVKIILIVFIPLAITGVKLLRQYKIQYYDEGDEDNSFSAILPVVYICFMLMIFVLSFTKSPLVQYRFFYYSYSFLPLMLPLLVVKPPKNTTYWFVLSAFLIIRFFLIHNHSTWRYASVSDILASTIYYYWTGNFHWMYFL